MEKSAKAIAMSVYLLLLTALCIDLRTGSTVSKWAYGAVLPTVGFTASMSAHWMKQDKTTEDNAEEWIWNGAESIYNSDIHINNLKIVSYVSYFVSATIVPFSLFSVPLSIIRAAVVLFILIFLPYFFDLSIVLWATVAIFIILMITAGAILLAIESFGPCAGCVTFLAIYASYAAVVSIDPIVSIVAFMREFLISVSEIR